MDSFTSGWIKYASAWGQMVREYKEGLSQANQFVEPDPSRSAEIRIHVHHT